VAFQSRRCTPTPPCCYRVPIPRRLLAPVALAYPAPLSVPPRVPPASASQASAASDGGGGGARAAPASTPTAGIALPRAPPYCKRIFQVFQMFRRYVSSV
jgi:hypothetical protein